MVISIFLLILSYPLFVGEIMLRPVYFAANKEVITYVHWRTPSNNWNYTSIHAHVKCSLSFNSTVTFSINKTQTLTW